jgi:hypothetical protein
MRWARIPLVPAAWRTLRSVGIVELAARAGYASRGLVYLSIGFIALLRAGGVAPHAEGAVGAMRAWSQWPIGVFLLWIAGLGLCAFASWRFLQAFLDVEHLGVRFNAVATRLGKAISGLLYGYLGFTVLKLLDALREFRKSNEDAEMQASIEQVLALPFGRSLIITFGVLLFAVGLGNMLRAILDHFTKAIACHPSYQGPIGLLGRIGYFARGVAFLPAAGLITLAGYRSRPHHALSMGHSLDTLLSVPFGRALLIVQALGLAAFGVFGMAKALWRRVELDEDI